MSSEMISRTQFASKYRKIQKKREELRDRPLKMEEIAILLSIRFNNKPLFPSIEVFYTDEYKEALKKGVSGSELEKIEPFRKATEEEINLLFCDIHTREEKLEYSSINASD
ncbi:MAG: hypothetical protein N2053_05995 [Chitinispirillaceae bacterium]|nr:hypothetical protein [Chitinispirillaceae bacterium]